MGGITVWGLGYYSLVTALVLAAKHLGPSDTTVDAGRKWKRDICQICSCKRFVLECSLENSLDDLPVVQNATYRNTTTEMLVVNQRMLRVFSSDVLQQYPNLAKLEVVNCAIETIPNYAFSGLHALRQIRLERNNIQDLSWRVFDRSYVAEISLEGNPLSCSCVNYWMRSALSWHKNPSVDEEASGSKLPRIIKTSFQKLACVKANGSMQLLSDMHVPNCELPTVEVNPRETDIREGGLVEANCVGKGTPEPEVRWETSQIQSRFSVLPVSSSEKKLVLYNVSSNDLGWIACQADNDAGRTASRTRIIVHAPPQILLLEDKKLFHWCIFYSLTGYPLPNKTWLFNDRPIDFADDLIDEAFQRDVNHIEGCLQIRSTTLGRHGKYSLLAANALGEAHRSVHGNFHKSLLPPMVITFDPQVKLPPPFLEEGAKQNSQIELPAAASAKSEQWAGFYNMVVLLPVCFMTLVLGGAAAVVLYARRRDTLNERRQEATLTIHMQAKNVSNRDPSSIPWGPVCLKPKRNFLPYQMRENPHYERKLSESMEENPDGILLSTSMSHPVIDSNRLEVQRDLGEGAFGRVHLAVLRSGSEREPEKNILVAVKTLKNTGEEAWQEFKHEANLLASLQHANIVHFIGACLDDPPFKLVFEYMEFGDLNHFLRLRGPDAHLLQTRTNPIFSPLPALGCLDQDELASAGTGNEMIETNSLSLLDLLQIGAQIATGMEFLAVRHYVHRDLATRNCLVGKGMVIKIGDFGMCRDIYMTDYYRVVGQTLLPVRWMPPESILYRKFTEESDVWSFGVVLWEIFSFGKQPWFGCSNHEVIQQVTAGHELDCPPGCPQDAYQVMVSCWAQNPHERSHMADIHCALKRLCTPREPHLISV